MKTVIKTVKQHSLEVKNIDELKAIAEKYTTVKNYTYSRYSGINSILILNSYRKEIRDIWVKAGFASQWNIPARYWKMALDEAVSNIKAEWTNTKNRVKKAIYHNSNITEDERRYILYILKSDSILFSILTYRAFNVPDKLRELKINEKYIYSLIRRYIRKYKGSIPYSRSAKSFMIDADMYNYKLKDNKLYLYIQGLKRNERIEIELKDKNIHKGNLRILLKDTAIEVHKAKNIKVKSYKTEEEKVIGIDKGYRCLIAASDNKFYGEHLNDYLSAESERLNEINTERNRHWALMKKYEKEGNIKKAENIRKFNLGRVKYNKNKLSFDISVKSYISKEINRLLKESKPTEIVVEDLTFVSYYKDYPPHIRRKLSGWIKGYIEERLKYKCELNGITKTLVNPAYTSQVCHKCGRFGVRDNEIFKCSGCGSFDADYNASNNIKSRKYDNEITLYTPYKKVKEILMKRAAM